MITAGGRKLLLFHNGSCTVIHGRVDWQAPFSNANELALFSVSGVYNACSFHFALFSSWLQILLKG